MCVRAIRYCKTRRRCREGIARERVTPYWKTAPQAEYRFLYDLIYGLDVQAHWRGAANSHPETPLLRPSFGLGAGSEGLALDGLAALTNRCHFYSRFLVIS